MMGLAREADSDDVRWFKSSYSGGAGSDCVEVGPCGLVTSLRDSKAPLQGIVTVPTSAFAAFVNDLKARVTIRETR
ncbi:DUF397 domain-containing protein [Streptomyces sp. NPDC002671]